MTYCGQLFMNNATGVPLVTPSTAGARTIAGLVQLLPGQRLAVPDVGRFAGVGGVLAQLFVQRLQGGEGWGHGSVSCVSNSGVPDGHIRVSQKMARNPMSVQCIPVGRNFIPMGIT